VAILEASAAGLPVISTIHAGIPDVINNGTTGLLSEEHDVDTMANNMIRLLNNPDLAKQLGAAGKEHIKKYFSLERHINELQKVINEAISNSKK
jgi:glycosyltransferase involved in cell wall biosynthesis